MEQLEKSIEGILSAELPGAEVHFDPYPGFGKLHTKVIWSGFEDVSLMDRQRRVWDILKSGLTEEQRFQTGFLLTVTPIEISAMQEQALAA